MVLSLRPDLAVRATQYFDWAQSRPPSGVRVAANLEGRELLK